MFGTVWYRDKNFISYRSSNIKLYVNKGDQIMNIISIFSNFKENIDMSINEKKNKKYLIENGYVVNDYRVCSASNDSLYIPAYMDKKSKKIYFLSERIVENGCILVDEFQNTYIISNPNHEVNNIIKGDKPTITTIADYSIFTPDDVIRNSFTQQATINQTVNGLNNIQNSGTIVLNVDQRAKIEQTATVEQLMDAAEVEAKYRFKPLKDQDTLFSLLRDIVKGLKGIDALEDKIIKAIIDEATGLLKEAIDLLIKKIRAKNDSKQ